MPRCLRMERRHEVVQGTRGPGLLGVLDLNSWDAFTLAWEVAKMVMHADQAAPHLTEDRKGQREVAAALHTAAACAHAPLNLLGMDQPPLRLRGRGWAGDARPCSSAHR